MKRTALLHADLSRLVATLGHGDMLVLGDAGLPIPAGPERIDLAVRAGLPGLREVLETVLTEMQVERALIAREAISSAAAAGAAGTAGQLPPWCRDLLPVAPELIGHAQLKQLCSTARAVVRTGEFTPYANIVLVAGVCF